MTHFTLVHGWGLDPKIWEPLIFKLQPHPVQKVNLGFFGSEKLPTDPHCDVVIAHSVGALWALKNLKFNMLVSIGGFTRFIRGRNNRNGISGLVIKRMRERLKFHEKSQLEDFYAACDLPQMEFKHPNYKKLTEGLDWLQLWDYRLLIQDVLAPVLALHSDNDRIVPLELAHDQWDKYADLRIAEGGGHGLPYNQPNWCAEQIMSFIDDQSAFQAKG